MKIRDFEQMQQNLDRMKQNLEDIKYIEPSVNPKKKASRKTRRAVEKKINRIIHPTVSRIAREEQIIVITTIIIVAITFVFSTNIFAKTISENSDDKNTEIMLENNKNAIELEEILLENVSVLKSKEYVEETRNIEFQVIYNENPNLPKGEEVILEPGKEGKENVKVIKSYENNEFVSEEILDSTLIEICSPQFVEIGTSEFLAENKVHIGDKMYAMKEIKLMTGAENSSDEICKIPKYLDVILEGLESEEWGKVTYDGLEGYVKLKYLTSGKVTPGIIDANKIERIKLTLSIDMPLNESTDLELEDYQKILSGNKLDKNKVIEENAEVFYNMDKKCNMNGVFLAAMAIHESGWGTSTISKDKKNLFGYGAYDSSAYESSFSFETYSESIERVAKALTKYYLNEEGTLIYDEEIAKGSYYNGPTVAGVNVRYASDLEWHNKVYKYMEYLYNRL